MTATATAKRFLPLALATGLGVAFFAGAANGRPQSVGFVAGADRVVQGNPVTIEASVSPAGASCSLAVRYKGGSKQKGLRTVAAAGGHASWTWTVSKRTPTGRATVTVSCAGAGRATRSLMVIGQVLPPKIDVVQTGWSVRVYPYGGSGVSWGVILENTSKTRDAVDVNVLCNFVMADNRLIGSASQRIGDISAGTKHAIGGELTFPGGAPIDRLEVTVESKGGPLTRTKPGISFVRLMPNPYERDWTGSIEGEVQNDDPAKTIQSFELSGVVFDAEGNILGGAHGFGIATLPPAARVVLKITSGLRPILYAKAASAMVSVVPRYKTTP